jgi:hypothetical protein
MDPAGFNPAGSHCVWRVPKVADSCDFSTVSLRWSYVSHKPIASRSGT